QQAQTYAERALLIPVGAALVARDNVIDATKPYFTRDTVQRQVERDLRRFERRGTTARNRVERELKKTRTRVERELRQRRNGVQREVRRNRRRVEREARNLRSQAANGVERVANNTTA